MIGKITSLFQVLENLQETTLFYIAFTLPTSQTLTNKLCLVIQQNCTQRPAQYNYQIIIPGLDIQTTEFTPEVKDCQVITTIIMRPSYQP